MALLSGCSCSCRILALLLLRQLPSPRLQPLPAPEPWLSQAPPSARPGRPAAPSSTCPSRPVARCSVTHCGHGGGPFPARAPSALEQQRPCIACAQAPLRAAPFSRAGVHCLDLQPSATVRPHDVLTAPRVRRLYLRPRPRLRRPQPRAARHLLTPAASPACICAPPCARIRGPASAPLRNESPRPAVFAPGPDRLRLRAGLPSPAGRQLLCSACSTRTWTPTPAPGRLPAVRLRPSSARQAPPTRVHSPASASSANPAALAPRPPAAP
ncbi:hypothetical protein VPH35_030344 [Triticum aestivum]